MLDYYKGEGRDYWGSKRKITHSSVHWHKFYEVELILEGDGTEFINGVPYKVGKTTHYRTETYYTWDYHDSWEQHSEKISFCGIEFDYNKIIVPSAQYLDTIKESSHVRYVYYVVDTEYTGTIYTNLFDGTISDNSKFFRDTGVEESLEQCTVNYCTPVFWVLWCISIWGSVVGFYYLENRWLD